MKKFLLSLFLLFSLAVTAAAAGTDILDNKSMNGGTEKTTGSYSTVTTTPEYKSGAQYAAKFIITKNKNGVFFQINCANKKGTDLVTTKSGGCSKECYNYMVQSNKCDYNKW